MKRNFYRSSMIRRSLNIYQPGGGAWAIAVAIRFFLGGAGSLVSAAGLPAFDTVTSPQAALVSPARLATDSQSHLLVADPLAGNVVVVDAAGATTSVQRSLGQPLGLAVAADGKIYVGDAKAGTVSVFDAQWNLLSQLGRGTGEFQLPGYLTTLTEDGVTTVFVSDGLAHQVKAYRNGTLVGQYGSYGMGPAQFNFPAGLWATTNGQLFVVDQNNDRVQVLDRNGNFLRWFTLQPVPEQSIFSGRAQGLAGDDSAGWLYVADTFQGRVKVFNFAGTFLGYVSNYGDRVGELSSPGGLTVDRSGRLWVANANNGRVEGFLAVQSPVLLWNRTPAGDFVLTWNDSRFDVQAAATLTGPWQTIVGASPATVPGSTVTNNNQQYFRLVHR